MGKSVLKRDHAKVVEEQFGPQALDYVRSAVHAVGEDLDAIEAVAKSATPVKALDLGTGGGHVAYRLAKHAQAVVACDLSEEMLKAVSDTAISRGLSNISTRRAASEHLPFEDAEFDMLACRFSAHHWRDLDAGLREGRRVTQIGRPVLFVDVVSPGDPLLDTHLQAIEVLRDPSHVRDYSAAEWVSALGRTGFIVQHARIAKLRIEYAAWLLRMRTQETRAKAILDMQRTAAAEVRRYFGIEPDGSFTLDVMTVEATA